MALVGYICADLFRPPPLFVLELAKGESQTHQGLEGLLY